MSDTHAMAALRSELLNAMSNSFPAPRSTSDLESDCRVPFLTRDKSWFKDAVQEQLKVLVNAGLVRTMHGGYTLTEKGRRDRQQAARFFNKQPPQDAA
jgi:predicted transcriptional regulator